MLSITKMISFFLLAIAGLSGLIGAALSNHIRVKKSSQEKFICPVGFDCETVIHSRYSKFLGIPNENLGILYYLFVAGSYAIFLFVPSWHGELFSFTVISATTLAFIFSVYLTFIQAVVLRQWCTFCLFSTALCTLIFIVAWSQSDFDFIRFLNFILESVKI